MNPYEQTPWKNFFQTAKRKNGHDWPRSPCIYLHVVFISFNVIDLGKRDLDHVVFGLHEHEVIKR
jgi:hypothetical protein